MAILTHTRDSLPTYAPSSLNCTSCHLDEGRRPNAAPLAGVMARCSTEFGAMAQAGKAEEVRGYGNRRAEPILKTLEDYDFTAESFFATWGIEVRPLGARPNPLAGG